ncbi:hypothetical protein E2C01_003242 [Portunus trituberculatus]|uniref:Secreted protein n=1 Tax=Portunus trituberculatus TaxID=210409 RepID=A0A5B7CN69_PORTR|nr:hypothetical protein [Portunus trituberculatus]
MALLMVVCVLCGTGALPRLPRVSWKASSSYRGIRSLERLLWRSSGSWRERNTERLCSDQVVQEVGLRLWRLVLYRSWGKGGRMGNSSPKKRLRLANPEVYGVVVVRGCMVCLYVCLGVVREPSEGRYREKSQRLLHEEDLDGLAGDCLVLLPWFGARGSFSRYEYSRGRCGKDGPLVF